MTARNRTSIFILIFMAGLFINTSPSQTVPSTPLDSLKNASFEVWVDSLPDGWMVELGAEERSGVVPSKIEKIENAKVGKYAVRLSGDRTTELWSYLFQGPFKVDPDKMYKFSGWMRTKDVRVDNHAFPNCNLAVITFDENGNNIKVWFSPIIQGTTEWTKREVIFKPSERAKTFKACIFLSMSGSADFDGLKLEPYWPLSEPPATTRDGKWRQDVEYFARILPKFHINPFSLISREDFERKAKKLIEDVPTLSDSEIIVHLMKLIASIGDSHTTLSLNNLSFSRYPIHLKHFKDGFCVIAAAENIRRVLNCRLVRIENFDITDVCKVLSRVIPHENEFKLFSDLEIYIKIPEILYALGILKSPGAGVFVFENKDGDLFDLEINPVSQSSKPKIVWKGYPSQLKVPAYLGPKPFYSFKYFEDSNILLIDYSNCVEMPNKSIEDFTNDIFSLLDSLRVEKCIFDLRGNEGGNSALAKPLISGLRERYENNRIGKAYVLIGPRTYSSGLLNAIQFRDSLNAVVVGEPSGGKPNHFGEVRTFSLPFSQIVITYSTNYFKYTDDDSPSMIPDVIIELTSDDFFSARDPVLEALFSETAHDSFRHNR